MSRPGGVTLNEELATLNTQLEEKVQDVIAANDDLANLLASTDIATVFVDTDLQIKPTVRRWPAARASSSRISLAIPSCWTLRR